MTESDRTAHLPLTMRKPVSYHHHPRGLVELVVFYAWIPNTGVYVALEAEPIHEFRRKLALVAK